MIQVRWKVHGLGVALENGDRRTTCRSSGPTHRTKIFRYAVGAGYPALPLWQRGRDAL